MCGLNTDVFEAPESLLRIVLTSDSQTKAKTLTTTFMAIRCLQQLLMIFIGKKSGKVAAGSACNMSMN